MVLQLYLLFALSLYIQVCSGGVVMTQKPSYISVFPGQKLVIFCTSSSSTYISSMSKYEVNWYQLKEKHLPNLLIYFATTLHSETPTRFSATGSGNDFSLTIDGVQEEDAGLYYCSSDYNLPITFGQPTTVEIKRTDIPNSSPAVVIFRPSEEEIKEGKATVVCLVENFYPGNAQVSWKADNSAISQGVETSEKTKDKNNNYSISSFLTMSSDAYKAKNEISCVIKHETLSTDLVKTLKTSECSF